MRMRTGYCTLYSLWNDSLTTVATLSKGVDIPYTGNENSRMLRWWCQSKDPSTDFFGFSFYSILHVLKVFFDRVVIRDLVFKIPPVLCIAPDSFRSRAYVFGTASDTIQKCFGPCGVLRTFFVKFFILRSLLDNSFWQLLFTFSRFTISYRTDHFRLHSYHNGARRQPEPTKYPFHSHLTFWDA
jgi:hypothetical protein